jgi:hypothetical protein
VIIESSEPLQEQAFIDIRESHCRRYCEKYKKEALLKAFYHIDKFVFLVEPGPMNGSVFNRGIQTKATFVDEPQFSTRV